MDINTVEQQPQQLTPAIIAKAKAYRRRALVALFLCIGFCAAAPLLSIEILQNYSPTRLLFYFLRFAVQLFTYLKLLLPIPKDKHRKTLITLLVIWLVLSIEAIDFRSPISFIGPFTSPEFWMLLGALRRKNMARAAMVPLIILTPLLIIAFLVSLLSRSIEMIIGLFFAAALVICFLIVLRNWPVLERPLLRPKT